MKSETQLATQEPSVGLMLQGVLANIQTGQITTQHVEVLKGMMDLYERNEERQAKKDFTTAMVSLKRALPPIKTCKVVPNKDGTPRYSYAPLDEIDGKLRPVALEHGFTYDFADGPFEPDRVTKLCIVSHEGGHSKTNPFTVRIGNGPPQASASQIDGAAATYAMRRALCDAFGIIAEADTDGADARIVGKPITPEEVEALKKRCEATKTNKGALLRMAEVEHFEDIMSSQMDMLNDVLAEQEKKRQAAQDDAPSKTDLF